MITLADLEAALADERHLGWGYATRDVIEDDELRERLDAAVVDVANELGLDREGLFVWVNSKHGRWLVDRVHGRDELTFPAVVRQELTKPIVAALVAEEARA